MCNVRNASQQSLLLPRQRNAVQWIPPLFNGCTANNFALETPVNGDEKMASILLPHMADVDESVALSIQHIIGTIEEVLWLYSETTTQGYVRMNNNFNNSLPWVHLRLLAGAFVKDPVRYSALLNRHYDVLLPEKLCDGLISATETRLLHPHLAASANDRASPVTEPQKPGLQFPQSITLATLFAITAVTGVLMGRQEHQQTDGSELEILKFAHDNLKLDFSTPSWPNGWTVMYVLAASGIGEVLVLGVEYELDCRYVDAVTGAGVWHQAVATALGSQHPSCIKVLNILLHHKHGPFSQSVSLKQRNFAGETPLDLIDHEIKVLLAQQTHRDRQLERLAREGRRQQQQLVGGASSSRLAAAAAMVEDEDGAGDIVFTDDGDNVDGNLEDERDVSGAIAAQRETREARMPVVRNSTLPPVPAWMRTLGGLRQPYYQPPFQGTTHGRSDFVTAAGDREPTTTASASPRSLLFARTRQAREAMMLPPPRPMNFADNDEVFGQSLARLNRVRRLIVAAEQGASQRLDTKIQQIVSTALPGVASALVNIILGYLS